RTWLQAASPSLLSDKQARGHRGFADARVADVHRRARDELADVAVMRVAHRAREIAEARAGRLRIAVEARAEILDHRVELARVSAALARVAHLGQMAHEFIHPRVRIDGRLAGLHSVLAQDVEA